MMGVVVEPIHTAAIGVANVRYFRDPVTGQGPWVSFEDLFQCASLSRHQRRCFLATTKDNRASHGAAVHTASGPTTIIDYVAAQGFVTAMREVGQISPAIEEAFTAATEQVLCDEFQRWRNAS